MGVTQQSTQTKMPCAGARVLVVDDEPAMRDVFRDLVAKSLVGCKLTFAASMREARNVLNNQSIDLLVADVNLPDGNGLALLPELNRVQPDAAAIVITGEPSVDGAVTALRSGAVDFVTKPFTIPQLTRQLEKAIQIQQLRHRQQNRLKTLKEAVKRLNAARKTVSKKVDLLCNDLINAYGELSRQLETVRIQESYKQFVENTHDLEQLLCHSMDWLLRQVGYCNIGIWLASAEEGLQLGAFMKYTVSAEPELNEAIQKNLLRMAVRRGYVRLREPEIKSNLTPVELKYLTNQDIMALNCTYLGESLAVILLFRDGKTPFSEDDVIALKTISPLFALALAKSVRGHDADDRDDRDGRDHHDDSPAPEQPKSKKKPDPADWWKRGDQPPF
jgi:FixJ family two-component response regulator